MFDKSKEKVKNKEPLGNGTNRLFEGTLIQGDISTKTDFRLDGTLVGNYSSSAKLVIGPSGEVNGNINCKNLDIEGKFKGKLQVKELLAIKAKAHIEGEVQAGRLSVEPGAIFEATCTMHLNSKENNEKI